MTDMNIADMCRNQTSGKVATYLAVKGTAEQNNSSPYIKTEVCNYATNNTWKVSDEEDRM
jgi:hypothetical protein